MSDIFFFFLYYQSGRGPVHKACDEAKCACVRYKKNNYTPFPQQKHPAKIQCTFHFFFSLPVVFVHSSAGDVMSCINL